MPKTGLTGNARKSYLQKKSMNEGLLRQNGFDMERTVKGQKSPYHKKHGNLRVREGDDDGVIRRD